MKAAAAAGGPVSEGISTGSQAGVPNGLSTGACLEMATTEDRSTDTEPQATVLMTSKPAACRGSLFLTGRPFFSNCSFFLFDFLC